MALTIFSIAPAHIFSQAAIFLSTIHLFFGVNKNQFHGKSMCMEILIKKHT